MEAFLATMDEFVKANPRIQSVLAHNAETAHTRAAFSKQIDSKTSEAGIPGAAMKDVADMTALRERLKGQGQSLDQRRSP